MTRTVRIGVIGGGSVFTPELIEQLAVYGADIGAMEIRLMDVDARRLEIVSGLCRRIAAATDATLRIENVAGYDEAIAGADFVLVQLRAGGVAARIKDEKLGLKYRLPFTETISVCGFATYLRTYPVAEIIAETVQRLAPNAWLMNFTNPAGVLAETFARLGCPKVVGVCNASLGLLDALAGRLGAAPDEIFMTWRGLNHLTFTDAIYYKGRDILPEILDAWGDDEQESEFPVDLIRTLGAIPNGYLQYYYLRDQITEKLQARKQVRSEVVQEIEHVLLDTFARVSAVPEELKKRGGYGYSRLVALLIRGILTDDRSIRYAIVRNGTTLPELPHDAFVEVPVQVKADGIRALQAEPLPAFARGLVVTMKQYERVLIEAAIARDHRLLMQSLIIHPLMPSYEGAKALLADVLAITREYAPGFL